MQAASQRTRPVARNAWTPATMALYLHQTAGDAAPCFAREMHDGAAWANPGWATYWAAVLRSIEARSK